jgi:hypothetical protein
MNRDEYLKMSVDEYLEVVRKEKSNEEYIDKPCINFPLGHRTFEINTPYGIFVFCFQIEKLKFDFETMSKTYIGMLNKLPTTVEDIVNLRIFPEETEILDMEIDFESDAEIAQVRKIAGKAFDYFNDNITSMFREVMERYVYECYALGILRSASDDYYVLNVSESEFFTRFSKVVNKSMRERMKIKNLPKKAIIWTSEKLLNLLDSYENIYDLIKKARKFYKMSEDDKFSHRYSREGKIVPTADRVKMAFPELEETTIDDFKYKDRTNNMLAIEALIRRLDLNLEVSSVSSLLVDARIVRKNP